MRQLINTLRRSHVDMLGETRGVTEPDKRLTHLVKEASFAGGGGGGGGGRGTSAAASAGPDQSSSAAAPYGGTKSCSHLLALRRTLKVSGLSAWQRYTYHKVRPAPGRIGPIEGMTRKLHSA